MIKGLTHVAIRVTDIDRAVAFYRDVLGLSEQFQIEDDNGNVCLAYLKIAPGQFIELFGGATGPHQAAGTAGPCHLCLEVEDIQAAYEKVTSRGIESLHGKPSLEADHAWQFWIADPDGNPIEFHQFTVDSLQLRRPQ